MKVNNCFLIWDNNLNCKIMFFTLKLNVYPSLKKLKHNFVILEYLSNLNTKDVINCQIILE